MVNTIAHCVQDWCLHNKDYMNSFVLWLHEVDDVYYNFRMNKLNFKYVIMDSYYAYDVYTKKINIANQLLKVLYLPNPSYISVFDDRQKIRNNLRAQYGISNDTTVFLNVGVISNYKNQIEIINAIEKYILNDNLDFMLLLVGNAQNIVSDHINKSLFKHKLKKHIQILPSLPHNETNIYYAMSDVYISSAHTEVYGKVIVEALELSLPVIGFFGGSHIELIINDYNGLHYKSEKELADCIKLLCNNKNLIELYGKQAHWYYKLKIPTLENFYNQFNGIMTICKNNFSFNIKFNRHEQNDKFKLLEANAWIYNNLLCVAGGFTENVSSNNVLFKLDIDILQIVDTTADIPKNCAKTHTCKIIHGSNVLFIAGQIEDGYGKATNACYVYSNNTNTFTEINKFDNCYYELRGFIKDNYLIMFSGGLEDRSTPNFNILKCKIFDENNNLIFNNCPKWELEEIKFAGTLHSTLIQCAENKHIFIGGCQCHSCVADPIPEWHMYIHNHTNYIIDNNFNKVNISQQQFQTSHIHSSCIYNESLNAIIVVGGQANYDNIYYGLQIYYIDYDIWANITLDKFTEHLFNKGCCVLTYNNKLYLMGGQLKSFKFNEKLSVFDIE